MKRQLMTGLFAALAFTAVAQSNEWRDPEVNAVNRAPMHANFFAYETADGRPTDKVVFVSWIPDTCKVRAKMTYSGTKEAVKSAFVGISVNINATDMSEITQDVIIEQCNKV